MNCKYPVTIWDRVHQKSIQVPCGKCIFCCAAKARDWQNRLKKEFNYKYVCFFVTLTYSDDNIPLMAEWFAKTNLSRERLKMQELHLSKVHNTNYDTNLYKGVIPSLQPSHLTNYIKRLRINIQRHNGKYSKEIKCKYFAIGEYGPQTFRPHYHLLLAIDPNSCLPHEFMRNLVSQEKRKPNGDKIRSFRDYFATEIERSWPYGFVEHSELCDERIQYVTKYVYKFSDNGLIRYFERYPGLIKPFKRSSNGIGESYVNNNLNSLKYNNVLLVNGHANRVPRYMREKVKSQLADDERLIYEQSIAYTEEKQNEVQLKLLHIYQVRNKLPLDNNIYDLGFINWQESLQKQQEYKIKNSLTKKKKV